MHGFSDNTAHGHTMKFVMSNFQGLAQWTLKGMKPAGYDLAIACELHVIQVNTVVKSCILIKAVKLFTLFPVLFGPIIIQIFPAMVSAAVSHLAMRTLTLDIW